MFSSKIFSIFISSLVCLTPQSVFGLWENCDHYLDLVLGQQYTFSSPGYPNFYGSNPFSCRWSMRAPTGYVVALSCYIEIPVNNNCDRDRLEISRMGYPSLQDADVHCGKGNFEATSIDSNLVAGLIIPFTTGGGRFTCNLSAIQRDCSCGPRKRAGRIVGGTETLVNEFPMMTGLVDLANSKIYCGGTIISQKHILTAAHCLIRRMANTIGALVGDHDISTGSETPYSALYTVASYVLHESYSESLNQHDIAIMTTVNTIQFNAGVAPACLPFRYRAVNMDNQWVEVAGWGSIGFGGPTSNKLLKASLQTISNAQCSSSINNIIAQQICTYNSGKDSCQNDSGGPVFFTDNRNVVYSLGVVNYGIGCASTYPSVNVRVTSYLQWIQSKTPSVNYCAM